MEKRNVRLMRALPFLAAGVLAFTHAPASFAQSNGITGYSGMTAGSDCTSCHDPGATLPTMTITGATSVAPGATTSYVVTLTGGPAVNAGIDIAASGGTLAVVSPGTILQRGEITHSSPATFTANGASFAFNWKAPTTAGTYTIYAAGLSTDGSGTRGDGMALKNMKVTVSAPALPPVASFTISPSPATVATLVTFDASASKATTNGTATVSTYDWNYGDNSAGSGVTSTHSYAAAGTYNVVLKITDSTGATATVTKALQVTAPTPPPPAIPTASFTISPSPATVGTAVTFNGSGSSTPNTSISSYEWNYGDNTALGMGVSSMHTYAAAGTYTVTLKVTDNTGATNSAMKSLTVNAVTTPPPPPPTTATGQQLYDQYCSSCHGPNGLGVKDGSGGPIVHSSAKKISRAIAKVPDMKSLSTLTSEQIQLIADYLKMNTSLPPPPVIVTGQDLYMQYCAACHGPDGKGIAGVAGGSIIGESVGDIVEAISAVPEMQSLMGKLQVTQIRSIANFLEVMGDETDEEDAGEYGDLIAPGENHTYGGRLKAETFGRTRVSSSNDEGSSSGGGSFDLALLGLAAFAAGMRRRKK